MSWCIPELPKLAVYVSAAPQEGQIAYSLCGNLLNLRSAVKHKRCAQERQALTGRHPIRLHASREHAEEPQASDCLRPAHKLCDMFVSCSLNEITQVHCSSLFLLTVLLPYFADSMCIKQVDFAQLP